MKILDRYLIKSFIPPFFVSFGIALFVLMMHFLWLYIDEMMGKGLGILELVELLFYLTIVLVPQALPIGVLISTVMVMGNLAERYELSSFKSAGVSLVRVMRPLMLTVGTITIFSFFTSDVLIPWANLKFYSRFYDIRKSKPTVSFQAGVFNDEFQEYTLRIGKKGTDGTSIENVLIYGNKNYNTNLINQTTAKSGEMMTTHDKQFIVMNLYDGIQYQETTGQNGASNRNYPFVRVKFKSWQKYFDLSEFDRRKTDEGLFKNNQKMLSSRQLFHAMDSIQEVSKQYGRDLRRGLQSNFTPWRKKLVLVTPTDTPKIQNINISATTSTPSVITGKNAPTSEKAKAQLEAFSRAALAGTPYDGKKIELVKKDSFVNKHLKPNFYDIAKDTSIPKYEVEGFISRAENQVQNVKTQIENTTRQGRVVLETRGKYVYEFNLKFTYALVCFIFLFIGAPMGAIVQKGGFGYPILVAIVFFMVFMISMIYGKNLKDAGSISPVTAAWVPVAILIPIAIVLTYRAVNDYKLTPATFDKIGKKLQGLIELRKRFSKLKTAKTTE
ncbi:MAG: LptF/LptG family permease [Saprospiraceae bacterium]|nr:LptF/LptG family permease [Saprospiraceae bacterium]